MEFSSLLKELMSQKGYTSKELIAKLNISLKECCNLDSVTLSRWLNNKTTPKVYKQLLIINFFNYSYLDYLSNIDLDLSESKGIDFINKYFSETNFYGFFYYIKNDTSGSISVKEIDDIEDKNLINFYSNINKNINYGIDLTKKYKTKLISHHYNIITSHLLYHHINKDYDYLSIIFNKEIVKNSILINASHINSTNLFNHFTFYFIEDLVSHNARYIYFMLYDKRQISLLDALGFELISIINQKSESNLFLYGIQVEKFLSNSIIINIIKSFYNKNSIPNQLEDAGFRT
ncbi:helix-turn-helix domain-containing protein [Photobacterium damselae]